MAGTSADRRATSLAIGAAVVTVGFQLAGKSTRDALFLSTFGIAALPRMLITAAAVSALLTILLTRIMVRIGPGRLIPPLFGFSGLLLLGEWGLIAVSPSLAAVLVYLHFVGLGALLVSGFWAMVNERFDPRTARGAIGRVTTGASIGALLGGLLSERVGAYLNVAAMLPILALLQFVAGALVAGLRSGGPAPAAILSMGGPARSAAAVFRASRYLRWVALFVMLTTVAEGLLDYVFKAGATHAMRSGTELLRLFAAFYTGTTVLAILVQLTLQRPLLTRLGIARGAGLLPIGVGFGAAGALALPGLGSVLSARAIELVLRNSIFRAGYEMLFTPVVPADKRATKLLLDVGATRIGDAAAGVLVQLAIMAGIAAHAPLLGATVLTSGAAFAIAGVLHLGYIRALERGLKARAEALPLAPAADPASLLHTFGGFDLSELRAEVLTQPGAPGSSSGAAPSAPTGDPLARRRAALSGPDPAAVRAALAEAPLPPALVEPVIGLVAWDEVAPFAIQALQQVAERELPRVLAHLLDPDEDFAIRRRLVLVLAGVATTEAVEGLMRALDDRRFEVRYRVGRALSRLVDKQPSLRPDREAVVQAILREVAVERGVWESRRVIDEADDEWSPMESDVVRDRATRSLEHVFTLLALVLPRDPLRLAYQGLHTTDPQLRGTALEYLASVLPERVREKLWPFLEVEPRGAAPTTTPDRALDALLASRESILLAIAEVRERRSRE